MATAVACSRFGPGGMSVSSIRMAAVATSASRGPGSDGAAPVSLAILAAPSAMALAIRAVRRAFSSGLTANMRADRALSSSLGVRAALQPPAEHGRPALARAAVAQRAGQFVHRLAEPGHGDVLLGRKYMATVRGATSAAAAMSAMVVASYPRSANNPSAARLIASRRLALLRSRSPPASHTT